MRKQGSEPRQASLRSSGPERRPASGRWRTDMRAFHRRRHIPRRWRCADTPEPCRSPHRRVPRCGQSAPRREPAVAVDESEVSGARWTSQRRSPAATRTAAGSNPDAVSPLLPEGCNQPIRCIAQGPERACRPTADLERSVGANERRPQLGGTADRIVEGNEQPIAKQAGAVRSQPVAGQSHVAERLPALVELGLYECEFMLRAVDQRLREPIRSSAAM